MNLVKNREGFMVTKLILIMGIIMVAIIIKIIVSNIFNRQARDVQRISTLTQIQASLNLYRLENATYPQGNGISLGAFSDCIAKNASGAPCTSLSGEGGFTYTDSTGGKVYLSALQADPTGRTKCTNPAQSECVWTYTKVSDDHYFINLWLEGGVGGLVEGSVCATEEGITSQEGACD